jgi:HSP20 family protein
MIGENMAITRWDPLRDVVSLQSRLNSLFQDYGRGQNDADALSAASFAPPVDIYEDENKLVLKLETPGIRQEDLDIQIENRTLTVRGERKLEKEEKQENFHRVEHRYGTFARTFSLPSTVDPESVVASYDAGVLKLEFAKRAEAKPRQVKVNVGSQPKQVQGTTQPQVTSQSTGTGQSQAGQSQAGQSQAGQAQGAGRESSKPAA